MMLWNNINIKYSNISNIEVFNKEFNYVGILGNDLLNKGVIKHE